VSGSAGINRFGIETMNESEADRSERPEKWVLAYELTWDDLVRHSVWAEWWGDDSEVVRPVLCGDPFSVEECDGFDIKSSFVTVEGIALKGCVTVCRGFGEFSNEVRTVEFFHENESFGFSCILPDLSAKWLSRYREFLGMPDVDIFPVWYETDIRLPDGSDLKGIFSPLEGHALAIE